MDLSCDDAIAPRPQKPAVETARKAEQEGRLHDAEALYRSFSDNPSTNRWLKFFYLCHGMKEKFYATNAKERFDTDIAKADPNTWADLARYGPPPQNPMKPIPPCSKVSCKAPWPRCSKIAQSNCNR